MPLSTADVCVHLFAFSCYAGLFGFFCSCVFLTPRIVAVALAVQNRTSASNSLDLPLGIKRMGEQTDEVPGLFSNNECTPKPGVAHGQCIIPYSGLNLQVPPTSFSTNQNYFFL